MNKRARLARRILREHRRGTNARRWLTDHGFIYYCHRDDKIMYWWQKCAHRPRWWRG